MLQNLVFCVFSFIFYCETTARASAASLRRNRKVQNKFNVRPTCTKYAPLHKNQALCVQSLRTFLMTKCVMHTVRRPSHMCKSTHWPELLLFASSEGWL